MPAVRSTPRTPHVAAPRHARRGLVLALALLAACEPVGVGAPPAHSTAAAQPPGSAAAAAPAASASEPDAAAPAPSWREAVRLERWRAAAEQLEALPPSEREAPRMRFLRARVASELGQHARVRALLEGIDLPGLADEVARLRAEAAAEVGPYGEASEWFLSRGKPRDLVRSARALAKGGDLPAARKVAERAVVEAQRLRRSSDERLARDARADLAVSAGTPLVAVPDWVWLATEHPSTSEGRAARKLLAEHKKPLSDAQWRKVVDALLDAGAGKDALEVLEAHPKIFAAAERAHRKAEALFKARRYTQAADAFLAASRVASGRTDEQLYYAARSLARSKREDDAVLRHREVLRRFKKSVWAERASFQIAQILSNQGRYAEAADAFTKYLAAFPKGAQRDDAEYLLSLSWLSAGEPARARGVLSKLASRSKKFDWGVFRELEGVAALRAGAREEALAIFRDVAVTQPLTWAALVARARLTAEGAPLPPVIEPAVFRPAAPLAPVFPERAKHLVELGLDADAESWIAQNEALASASFPGRETEALCAMYGQLSRAKRRYKVGSAAVAFESLMRAPSDAERWSWECLYPKPYASLVGPLEQRYAVHPGLVHALMRQESAFDPEVRSPVGAEGLMQLMPTTAEQAAKEASLAGFDPDEVRAPEVNIELGTFYVGKLLKTFEGSVPLAVAGYNAGPTAVSRWVETAKEHEADVWVARIPYEETRNYVVRVLGNLARYQWLEGGDAAVLTIPLLLPAAARAGQDDY